MKVSPLKVLVIDDSAHNRRTLTQLLESDGDVVVVDRASDGEEGLKKAATLRPDAITLDLEMPRLDGFAFLRLLMATAPTPVIVISSYAHKADVFKALELGAFDFVAKPSRVGATELATLREELLEKLRAVRHVRAKERRAEPKRAARLVPSVVAVGASTGGPPAIQRLLEALGGEPSVCLLICQHMPARFTRAFAERLNRMGGFQVREASDGDEVGGGQAFVAPGGKLLVLAEERGRLLLRTPAPGPQDKHAPSVDRLFESTARVLGPKSFGVVLTGMGADGARGAKAMKSAGGEVWAEAEETAVIFGMPKEAIDTGAVKRVLPLHELGPALRSHLRRR